MTKSVKKGGSGPSKIGVPWPPFSRILKNDQKWPKKVKKGPKLTTFLEKTRKKNYMLTYKCMLKSENQAPLFLTTFLPFFSQKTRKNKKKKWQNPQKRRSFFMKKSENHRFLSKFIEKWPFFPYFRYFLKREV